MLMGNENKSNLVIFYKDIDKLKEAFFNLFTIIEAAGGAVFNSYNQLLLIHRKGFWDLPKGKIEKSESIKEAAIREVEEETGILDPKIIKSIRFSGLLNEGTYHVYNEKGKTILKLSHWFLMHLENAPEKLTPQTEEDIQEAKWVNKSEVSYYFDGMFPSIVEVIQNLD